MMKVQNKDCWSSLCHGGFDSLLPDVHSAIWPKAVRREAKVGNRLP